MSASVHALARGLGIAVAVEVLLLAVHAGVVTSLGPAPIAAAMLSEPASLTAALGLLAVSTRVAALVLWPAGSAFVLAARAASRG